MVFEKNVEGIKTMFEEEYGSRMRYSTNIREKKQFKENYFDKVEQFLDENEKSEPKSEPKRDSLWDRITRKNNKQ
jgi:hypothetical protein